MHSSSLTPAKGFRPGLSIEFLKPGAETSDETELDTRLCPVTEKREIAGDAGSEVLIVKGEWGMSSLVSVFCESLYIIATGQNLGMTGH